MPREMQLAEPQTLQVREFSGVNVTDGRTAIEDREFSWLENAIPIGRGQVTLTPARGTALASVPEGVASLWGFTLAGTPVLIAIRNDGGVDQINALTGVKTPVAGAGVVGASARVTIWKDTDLLFIHPTTGYHRWDGTTFSTLSATRTGTAIEVFEGRVWIAKERTVQVSAPDSFTDFSPGGGGTSFVITDRAFSGHVTNLLSALQQLWIVGPGAINAISNVQVIGGTTTFSNVNVVSNVGSVFPSSVTAFFRTFLFLAPYGVYAVVGATPQKLSDKLDLLLPHLTLGTDHPAAIGTIYNLYVWCVLVTYNDPELGARPLLLCFTQGKWFFASPNRGTSGLTWITSLLNASGRPEVWGTNGTEVFRVFERLDTEVTYRVQTKLWDFGSWVTQKELIRVGLEFTSNSSVAPSVSLENENAAATQTVTAIGQTGITFTGAGGAPITFQGTGDIRWITGGLVLARAATPFKGHYFGLTLTGSERPWTLSALALQVKPGGEWN